MDFCLKKKFKCFEFVLRFSFDCQLGSKSQIECPLQFNLERENVKQK